MKSKWKKLVTMLSWIVRMDYRALFQAAAEVHASCGKSRLAALADILYCGLHYGAGYKDYLLCEFYRLPAEKRATYVTRGVNYSITRRLNDPAYYHCFDNKNEFYDLFSDLLCRDYLQLSRASRGQVLDFIRGEGTVMVKPLSECCGVGVEHLSLADFPDEDALYNCLRQRGDCVIEQLVVQHPALASMMPGCVNTLRIGTLMSCGEPKIAYAFLRIGNSDRPVDNLNAGGMCAPVDTETGIITRPGCDKNRISYEKHPRTGCPIVGFQIPMWEQCRDLVLEAAARVPQMGYIGWDVAVTEEGPLLIEGNNLCGYDILQLPPHLPEDKTGFLPRFRAIAPDCFS